jgi:hypothetical protein
MEEKKFPWLLRLLAINTCCLPLLETYAVRKHKVLSRFCQDPLGIVVQTPLKSLDCNTIEDCLLYFRKHSRYSFIDSPKQLFFLHQGVRTVIPQAKIKAFLSKRQSLPLVSYVQFSRSVSYTFVLWTVEYSKPNYKSTVFPLISKQSVLEEAKDISKTLIFLIEQHEKQKIVKLELELMIDDVSKVWISNLVLCLISPAERLSKMTEKGVKAVKLRHRSSELLDIENELASPSRVLKRQPSCITRIGSENSSTIIKIRSPILHSAAVETDSSSDSASFEALNAEKSSMLAGNPAKNNKHFIELLCRTRIIQKNARKKLDINEADYKAEYKSLMSLLVNPRKISLAKTLRRRGKAAKALPKNT